MDDIGTQSFCSIPQDGEHLNCITGANSVLFVCDDNGVVETGAVAPEDRSCFSLTFFIRNLDGTPLEGLCPTGSQAVDTSSASASVTSSISTPMTTSTDAVPTPCAPSTTPSASMTDLPWTTTSSTAVVSTSSSAPCAGPSTFQNAHLRWLTTEYGGYSYVTQALNQGSLDYTDGDSLSAAVPLSLASDGTLTLIDPSLGPLIANVPLNADPTDGTGLNSRLRFSAEADVGVRSFCSVTAEGGNSLSRVTGVNAVLYVCRGSQGGHVETGAGLPAGRSCGLLTLDVLDDGGSPSTEAYCPIETTGVEVWVVGAERRRRRRRSARYAH